MKKIKYVIFGFRNLVCKETETGYVVDHDTLGEFDKLISFLKSRKITPVVFVNDAWKFKNRTENFDNFMRDRWGISDHYYICSKMNIPKKPRGDSLGTILREKLNCEANEVLYIGNTINDMRTAVNSQVLFLNGTWICDNIDYGFKFESPREIAKFIDVFCIRDHDWEFNINVDNLEYYALAPFSTLKQEHEKYSSDAIQTAKTNMGHPEFWGKYICATLYLSGKYKDIDYVAPFPSHKKNVYREPIKKSIDVFAKCFRAKYLPDLIIRHETALESKKNRDSMNHKIHLDTLYINSKPIKNDKRERFVGNPLKEGKKVLVIDDICTNGRSLEAARILIQSTGAGVMLLSWLKTINSDYLQIDDSSLEVTYPHKPGTYQNPTTIRHWYSKSRIDRQASVELSQQLELFNQWDWC